MLTVEPSRKASARAYCIWPTKVLSSPCMLLVLVSVLKELTATTASTAPMVRTIISSINVKPEALLKTRSPWSTLVIQPEPLRAHHGLERRQHPVATPLPHQPMPMTDAVTSNQFAYSPHEHHRDALISDNTCIVFGTDTTGYLPFQCNRTINPASPETARIRHFMLLAATALRRVSHGLGAPLLNKS